MTKIEPDVRHLRDGNPLPVTFAAAAVATSALLLLLAQWTDHLGPLMWLAPAPVLAVALLHRSSPGRCRVRLCRRCRQRHRRLAQRRDLAARHRQQRRLLASRQRSSPTSRSAPAPRSTRATATGSPPCARSSGSRSPPPLRTSAFGDLPDDLPEVSVRIAEVARVDPPGPLVRRRHDRACGRGPLENEVDFVAARHQLTEAELPALRRADGQRRVLCQLATRVQG